MEPDSAGITTQERRENPRGYNPHMSNQLEVLEIALEESVKLQSHYAALLNMHDGGKRLQFTTSEEWIDRLVEIGQMKRNENTNVQIHITGRPRCPHCGESI